MKMKELKIAGVKGLQDVRVFRICDCDAVAAYTLEEAYEWYKDHTGLSEDELFALDEITEVSLDEKIQDSATDSHQLITVREVLDRYWEGQPFIAVTTEW